MRLRLALLPGLLLAVLCEARIKVSRNVANPALTAALQNPELGTVLHELIVKETTARAQLTADKEHLQKELEETKQKLANENAGDQQMLRKSKELAKANAQLTGQLDTTKSALVNSKKSFDTSAKELVKSNQELYKLHKDLQESDKELNNEKSALAEANADHAKADANLVKRLHQLSSTNTELKKEGVKLSEDEIKQVRRNQIGQEKLNTEEKTLTTVEAEKDHDESELKHEMSKLETEDEKLSQSRAMSNVKDKSLRQLDKALKAVRSEMDTAEKELHSLKNKVKTEEDNEQTLEKSDVQRLASQLNVTNAVVATKDKVLKSLHFQVAAEAKELARLRQESSAKDQVLNAATKEVQRTLATLASSN